MSAVSVETHEARGDCNQDGCHKKQTICTDSHDESIPAIKKDDPVSGTVGC